MSLCGTSRVSNRVPFFRRSGAKQSHEKVPRDRASQGGSNRGYVWASEVVLYPIRSSSSRLSVYNFRQMELAFRSKCYELWPFTAESGRNATREFIFPPRFDHPCMNLSRSGLSTNKASATTAKFIIAVTTKTTCHPPVAVFTRLAIGTKNADAPLAV